MTIPLDQARDFIRHNNRAILVTRRDGEGLQTSPVRALVDGDGKIAISTCASRAKARNLARDPRAALCVISESWFGGWIQVEGLAQVVRLPEAMPLLEDFYRRREGREHANWDEYRRTMTAEERVLLRISLMRAAAAAIS